MTRWKTTLEYDGAAFCGWQRQIKDPSIQQALEEAIHKFSGEAVTTHAAGRTDAGVHARAQVAHFDLHKETNADVLRDAVNFHLRPHKIAILQAEQVDATFHARFSARGRSYRYHIVNRRAPLTLLAHQAWHIGRPLDLSAMQKAADLLLGTHDFSTFRALHCQAKTPVKTLDRCQIVGEGENVFVHVEARSFLYHQVRNIVGTLSLIGTGAWSMEAFRTAFAACDRTKGGPTAPAEGLCFWDVRY